MKRNTIIITLLLLSVLPFLDKPVIAWDAHETHRLLAGYAADNPVLSISKDNYLKVPGFNNDLDENLKWNQKTKTIKEWIAFGGEAEDFGRYGEDDKASTSAYNHFHDP